jgi:hypothetical protein
MSALGQKQTCAPQKVMSALPPKADMCGAAKDVRFVPIADVATIGLAYRIRISSISNWSLEPLPGVRGRHSRQVAD